MVFIEMKRYILMIGFFMISPMMLPAQENNDGTVVVIQDNLVDSLLNQYAALRMKIMENPDHKAIPGYRIQIFFDSGLNSSDRAKQARDAFLILYPETPAYVSWKAPNYKVRVGDFRTKLEAEKILQMIIIDYPNAWVTKDDINFPVMN
jgi:hypothetical protein